MEGTMEFQPTPASASRTGETHEEVPELPDERIRHLDRLSDCQIAHYELIPLNPQHSNFQDRRDEHGEYRRNLDARSWHLHSLGGPQVRLESLTTHEVPPDTLANWRNGK